MPIGDVLGSSQSCGEAAAPLQRAVAQMRLEPRVRAGFGRRKASGQASGHMSGALGTRQILDPVTEAFGLETMLAGEGAAVKPNGADTATAGALEKGPAAAVGEMDVSDGDDEGRGGRRVGVGGGWESDDGGFVVGADEAGGAQTGNANVREIIDRRLHGAKIRTGKG